MMLSSGTGNVASIPLRTFDDPKDALEKCKGLEQEVAALLKDGVVAVVGKNGEGVPIMSLNDFMANYFRATGMRLMVCDVIHDDGAPEILMPSSPKLIVPT